MVEQFVQRLADRLDELERALADGDFAQLTTVAHWLKGSAGTLGLHEFTAPAAELEQAARSGERECAREQVAVVRILFDRIQLSDSAAGA